MSIEMGPRVLYAPDTVVATSVEGSETEVGKPAEANAGNGSPKTAPAWMAQLPGALKTDESLAKYATVGDAIKGLMATKAEPVDEVSEPVTYENFTRVLSTDDDPFGEIGRGLVESFQKKGIKQADAEELFDSFAENLKTAKANMVGKGRELCEKVVKAQWGNDYESKRALMAKGYQALGDTDGSLQRSLDETGASLSPAMWELLSRVGSLVSEDRGTPTKGTGGAKGSAYGIPIDYSKPSL